MSTIFESCRYSLSNDLIHSYSFPSLWLWLVRGEARVIHIITWPATPAPSYSEAQSTEWLPRYLPNSLPIKPSCAYLFRVCHAFQLFIQTTKLVYHRRTYPAFNVGVLLAIDTSITVMRFLRRRTLDCQGKQQRAHLIRWNQQVCDCCHWFLFLLSASADCCQGWFWSNILHVDVLYLQQGCLRRTGFAGNFRWIHSV
jgi:hypothetical protein